MNIDPFLGCKSFQKTVLSRIWLFLRSFLKITPSPSTPKCWDTDRAWTAWISSLQMRWQWKHQSIPSNNLHVCPQNSWQITSFCWWNQKIIGKSRWNPACLACFNPHFLRFSQLFRVNLPSFPRFPQRFPGRLPRWPWHLPGPGRPSAAWRFGGRDPDPSPGAAGDIAS